jgi:hypothetical protein
LRKRNEVKSDYERRAKKTEVRGRSLREAIGINSDDHPVKNRKLRDHLEHFDERLDDWNDNRQRKAYVQDNIGPWASLGQFDDRDVMRWYDPVTKEFLFRGERFSLQLMADGISDIRTKTKSALEQLNKE